MAEETITEKDWYSIPFPSFGEFNWLFASDPGTYKSVMLCRLLAYFHAHNFKICITEAKDYDMLNASRTGGGWRLHPNEYPTSVPVVGCIPTFASTQKTVGKLTKDILTRFNHEYTTKLSSLQEYMEWVNLMGVTEISANICHSLIRDGTVKTIHEMVNFFEKQPKIHNQVKMAVLTRMYRFVADDVFDVEGKEEIDISKFWDENLIPVKCYFLREEPYQQLDVGKTIQSEFLYSERMKHAGKPVKMLNIWDDCQSYFTREEENWASKMALRSIQMGRSRGFNNIFVIQNPMAIPPMLRESWTDIFLGYMQNYAGFDFIDSDILFWVKENRSMFSMDDKTGKKDVPYMHLNRYRKAQLFFPGGSICGYF